MRSVDAAILLLGRDNFRRMVTMSLLSELNTNQSTEVLHMALMRARFCEQTATLFALDPAEQYLLGLLSLAPALLDITMEELLQSVSLRLEICEALRKIRQPERSSLAWLECFERGDWEACDAIVQTSLSSRGSRYVDDLDRQLQCQRELNEAYADAVVWAGVALSECITRM